MVASWERPHLSDAQVGTAAKLRVCDQSALVAVAQSNTCPLCTKEIGQHHPLVCQNISHHGTAHDKLVSALAQQVAKNPSVSVRANKAFLKGPFQKDSTFRPDIAIEENGVLIEVKTLNADSHGPSLAASLHRSARDARIKYQLQIQRVPQVIATTTDGFMSAEGFRALTALTNIAYQDMPRQGPRLSLIAGFALCEAAAGAYEAWHCTVRQAHGARALAES